MEEKFGTECYNAIRGYRGITETLIEEGEIELGDTIEIMELTHYGYHLWN